MKWTTRRPTERDWQALGAADVCVRPTGIGNTCQYPVDLDVMYAFARVSELFPVIASIQSNLTGH
jgi:hypothetical protein